MAAYAEGLSVLRNADIGKRTNVAADAETTPLRDPEHYRYDMNLRDIAEVWRRGSVIASWLLEHASPCGRMVRLLASSVRGKGPHSWSVRHAAPRTVNKDEVEGGVLLERKGR